jgi:hypothetical protein
MTLVEFLGQFYCSAGAERSFRVDDQSSVDKSPNFCNLTVKVSEHDPHSFELVLERVPWDEHVEDVAEECSGEWTAELYGRSLTVCLNVKNITAVRRLAGAIGKVTGRGRRYSIPNWKWVSRRTAASLQILADRLIEFRRMRRQLLSKPGCKVA